MKSTGKVEYASTANNRTQSKLTYDNGGENNDFEFKELVITGNNLGLKVGDSVVISIGESETGAPAGDLAEISEQEAMEKFKDMITETIKDLLPAPVNMDALADLVVSKITPLLPKAAEVADPNAKTGK